MSGAESGLASVLFVCTANICRSAYAELVTAHRRHEGLRVSSAGTHGFVDRPVDTHMADQLLERGIDPSGFRSRPLTRAHVDDADLVLTATAAHRRFVLEEWPGAVRRTFTLGQLAGAIPSLDPGLTGADLLAAARRARATASTEDDVADPYGRGASAAAAAAEHIDELLDLVLPRLRTAAS